MKTRSDRIINLGVSLFIFGGGVVIGFAGLVASYLIHPAWVLGSSRIAEFSKNTGLANATQGLAAIGALVVGVPVSIGASMATLYVAHRSAKAAEQVERIERSRDRREIVQRLRNRAQAILKPYQDIAISLSKVDAASRDLIAVFIQSSPKLYNFHEQSWIFHIPGPIITRKFVVFTPETDSHSIELPPDIKKAAERLSTEILTLLRNVSAVVPDFESPDDSNSAASKLSQRFGRRLRMQFNALHFPVDGVSTQEENIHAEQSEFRSWRDLAAEIASQTNLESLIYKLDSLLVPCIFAPKTMPPASEVNVGFAVEGKHMPIWIPKLGIRHAATHWLECETTILGGIFWTEWKQDPSFYDFTAEEKSRAINENLTV